MILYLLRHGIAEDGAPGGDDRARRLTPRGQAKLRAAGAGLRGLGIELDALLTSPLVRARETAAIACEALGGTPAPEEVPALASGVAPVEMLRGLRPYLRHEQVMIVGHEPGLSGLVALLLAGSPDGFTLALKKGGLVALELAGAPPRAEAQLRYLLTPRQLRRLGR